MRIRAAVADMLRLPLKRPLPMAGQGSGLAPAQCHVLCVRVQTEGGLEGLGLATTALASARVLVGYVEDVLAPLIAGEDALDHLRLRAKIAARTRGEALVGIGAIAAAALDFAFWDLKGKAANLPLCKLLGGARAAVSAYASDVGWLWQDPDEIIECCRELVHEGLRGIRVQIGHDDPERDAQRLSRLRESIGEEIWLGVDADQQFDYRGALSMGRFLEEETAPDWFEDPLPADDLEGYQRLASKLDLPLAAGRTLPRVSDFDLLMDRQAAHFLRPDPVRLGGLTPCLSLIARAQGHALPVVPAGPAEVTVHLGCGLPGVRMVEYQPWLQAILTERLHLAEGKIAAPTTPGIGWSLHSGAIEQYRMR